jgi:ubiquinone/menaquinone biosynthesis C-methylase UbiE
MPEMPSHFKVLFRNPVYGLVARTVLLPWALQGVRPAGRALEVGCGTGAMAARLLARFPDLELVATDYDPEMVTTTQLALRTFGRRAQVQRADAAQLPFEDDRFDLVLAFAMFHHSGDWQRAVGEAIRVLRPGGRLVGYDILEGAPLHGSRGRPPIHAGHGQHPHVSAAAHMHAEADAPGHSRMIGSAQQLEALLRSLPVSDVRVRRSAGGVAIRFQATRAVAPAPG